MSPHRQIDQHSDRFISTLTKNTDAIMFIRCCTGKHFDAPTGKFNGEHTTPTAISTPAIANFLVVILFICKNLL